jgi:hypothetical protein
MVVFSAHLVIEHATVFSQLTTNSDELVDFSGDIDDNNEENSDDNNKENELEWGDEHFMVFSNPITLYTDELNAHCYFFGDDTIISISPNILDTPPELKG